MKTFLTLETDVTQLNTGFEQSKNILAASSDVLTLKPNTLTELEVLQVTLGWLTVGNHLLARSGVESLINKPAFGWACGSYVLWTGDDYILSELNGPIEVWKNELAKDRSHPVIYKELGSRALARAYHGCRNTSAAQDLEDSLIFQGEKSSLDNFEREQTDPLFEIPPLPSTPDQLAAILGLTRQGGNPNVDQLYLLWKQLNTLHSDSDTKELSDRLILASLIACSFFLGMMGTLPDASSGQLTLEPNIPNNLNYFRFRDLRMGLDAVDFAYMEEDGQHTFVIEQNRGRVPLNLIFKPNLSGVEIEQIYIDGELAQLEWWAHAEVGRVATQVQLYLDQKRTVTIVPA